MPISALPVYYTQYSFYEYALANKNLPPIAKNEYQQGNLIYGLHDRVNYYIKNVPFFNSANKSNSVSTLNQYKLGMKEYPTQTRYMKAGAIQTKSFINSILSNNKHKEILDDHDLGYKNYIFYPEDKYLSKKSKSGLNWSKEIGNKVHYILDDINFDSVVDKDDLYHNHYGENIVSITNSELRWLYRNRTDPDTQKSVQFWKDGRPANAPWADDPETWRRYKPRSEAGMIQQAEHHRNPVFARRRQSYRDAMLNELSYA